MQSLEPSQLRAGENSIINQKPDYDFRSAFDTNASVE